MNIKPGHIELFVSNTAASRDFYTSVLGFSLVTEQPGDLVWIEKDGLEFLLRPGKSPQHGATYRDANSGIVFYTDDLQKTAAELRAAGLEFKGFDGTETCLTFTDPDGNWFQLVNPNGH